jgi:hypothetical protein
MSVKQELDEVPGLAQALCALSYFRHRWDAKPSKRRRKMRVYPDVTWSRYLVRETIAEARKLGFRGSVVSHFQHNEGVM